MIKHFVFFSEEGRRGRFALALVAGDRVRFKQLAGPAPTPGHLLGALATWPGLVDAANEAARQYRLPRTVVLRLGMSGCLDYKIIEARETALADNPVMGTVHVSMYGRLNRPFVVRLADLGLLIERISLDYRPEPVVEAALPSYEPHTWPAGFVEINVQLDETGEPKITARRRDEFVYEEPLLEEEEEL